MISEFETGKIAPFRRDPQTAKSGLERPFAGPSQDPLSPGAQFA
jgi:hypothetical protein